MLAKDPAIASDRNRATSAKLAQNRTPAIPISAGDRPARAFKRNTEGSAAQGDPRKLNFGELRQ